MGSWTSSNPCKTCNNKAGFMIKCSNCGSLGCMKCIGGPGKGTCKICKKSAERIRI